MDSDEIEDLNKRLFLRGAMITGAGLIVPMPAKIFVPKIDIVSYYDIEMLMAKLAMNSMYGKFALAS